MTRTDAPTRATDAHESVSDLRVERLRVVESGAEWAMQHTPPEWVTS